MLENLLPFTSIDFGACFQKKKSKGLYGFNCCMILNFKSLQFLEFSTDLQDSGL